MPIGFGIEEPDRHGDTDQDGNIDEVVSPLDGFEGDGVDEDVEEDGELGGHETHADAFAAVAIGPDFAGVADDEGCELRKNVSGY